MEGSEYTEATIAMTERLYARFPGAVGTVLQAYLFRTDADADRLLGQGIRIRLCKGAYKEPAEIAFPAKADVDANYLKLAEAKHDRPERRLLRHRHPRRGHRRQDVCHFVDEHTNRQSPPSSSRCSTASAATCSASSSAEGYGVRVYVPFGTEWYPYFMRRLAERPANVLFLAKNFFKN